MVGNTSVLSLVRLWQCVKSAIVELFWAQRVRVSCSISQGLLLGPTANFRKNFVPTHREREVLAGDSEARENNVYNNCC